MQSARCPAARRLCAFLAHDPTARFHSLHHASPAQPPRRFRSISHSPASQPSPKTPSIDQPTTPAISPQTHYDFFPNAIPDGAPPLGSFDIDLSALKKEYLQLQARVHPDRHTQADKHRAEQLSSAINTAYQTLKSPLLRAQYILSLKGIDTAEEAKLDDTELLEAVFQAQELLEDSGHEEEVLALQRLNEVRIRKSVEVIKELFKHGRWELAKDEAFRLKYWMNIKDSIEHPEDN